MTQPDECPQTYIYDRASRTVVPKDARISQLNPFDSHHDDLMDAITIVPEPIRTEREQGQMIFSVVKHRAHTSDPERLTVETERVVNHAYHEHVVHAMQAQIQEQAKRIAELERQANQLADEKERHRWARINLDRVTAKLEATRDRLAHVKSVLRGSQRGNDRQARRIKRLMRLRRLDADKLYAEQRRLSTTIEAQRQTLAERMSTYVVRYDSTKDQPRPRIDLDHERWATLVIVVDVGTGTADVVKNRSGATTTATNTVLRSELVKLQASYDATLALVESHSERELQASKALAAERLSHSITRLINSSLNSVIGDLDADRDRLQAENDLLTAQRDVASARVNAQSAELVELRAALAASNESREALERHSVELRKLADWNETRWREAAKRSDEQRMAHQETRHRFNPDAILSYDAERSRVFKMDERSEDSIAWCIRSSMDKPHMMPVYLRNLIRDVMPEAAHLVIEGEKYQIGSLIEITDGIQPCTTFGGEDCSDDYPNPPPGYRAEIAAVDASDSEYPVGIQWNPTNDDDPIMWLGTGEFKVVRS